MIAGLFPVYAFIAYYFIAGNGRRPRRFGTVEDVPGISEYSELNTGSFPVEPAFLRMSHRLVKPHTEC